MISLFIIGIMAHTWAQTNDPCTAPALTVGTSCNSTSGSLNGFSIYSGGGFTNCASFGDPQGFYTFVATDASMTIEVVGSSTIDPVIDLSEGACGSLTNVDCEDGTGTGGTEVMNATGLTVGNTYTIAVFDYWGGNDAAATFDICVYGTSGGGGGTGNNCTNAVPLAIGGSDCATATDNSGSFGNGSSTDNPCSSFYNDHEYWYEITGTGVAIDIDLTSVGSTYQGTFVLDACPGSGPTCIASETNGSSTTDYSFTTPVLTNGATYYIVVSTWASVTGTPDFCISTSAVGGGGTLPTSCGDMEPICTNDGLTFTAQMGVGDAEAAEPGNDYGCLSYAELGDSPNPTWYYLEVATGGDINMELSAPNDIDFALWGPFTDLATAQGSCGSLPYPIDCSYSFVSTEYPDITNAQAGEVYILLITNFNNTVQNVTLEQIGGTGTTDCSIVCGSDAGTITSTMNNTNSVDYFLCDGEGLSFTSNDDYVLPPAVDVAGLGYAMYTAPPTTGDPSTDPNWTGYYWTGEDLTETNDINNLYDFVIGNPSGSAGTNGVPFGNQLVFVPITMDDIANIAGGGNDDGLDHDIDDDGCFALGTPLLVTYLNPIADAAVETCGANVVITLSGGYPEFVPGGSYTVNSTGAGTMVQSGGQGQTLTFTGLNTGDVISVDVTDDDNGCTHTLTFTATCPSSTSCEADTGNW
ncbi:MAG: hypothetical protein GY810_19590 [Aureispira sp.]|nr:hypothetical protein [Aureispira sp.]